MEFPSEEAKKCYNDVKEEKDFNIDKYNIDIVKEAIFFTRDKEMHENLLQLFAKIIKRNAIQNYI